MTKENEEEVVDFGHITIKNKRRPGRRPAFPATTLLEYVGDKPFTVSSFIKLIPHVSRSTVQRIIRRCLADGSLQCLSRPGDPVQTYEATGLPPDLEAGNLATVREEVVNYVGRIGRVVSRKMILVALQGRASVSAIDRALVVLLKERVLAKDSRGSYHLGGVKVMHGPSSKQVAAAFAMMPKVVHKSPDRPFSWENSGIWRYWAENEAIGNEILKQVTMAGLIKYLPDEQCWVGRDYDEATDELTLAAAAAGERQRAAKAAAPPPPAAPRGRILAWTEVQEQLKEQEAKAMGDGMDIVDPAKVKGDNGKSFAEAIKELEAKEK